MKMNAVQLRKRGILRTIVLFLLLQSSLTVTGMQQKQDQIQQAINSTKAAYYCEDEDYHTDGQRVVWVKSYKRWIPDDLNVMKKEAAHVLKFLGQAIQHNRFDVLEQLLPDYYRSHGGVRAFAADIQRTLNSK